MPPLRTRDALLIAVCLAVPACLVSFEDYPLKALGPDAGSAGSAGGAGNPAGASGTAGSGGSAGLDGSADGDASGGVGGSSGACGLFGQPCCPACSEGVCIGDHCASFGGAYELSADAECSNTQCNNGNPLAGDACTCPAGFQQTVLFGANDCADSPPGHQAVIGVCFADFAANAASDFAGVYQTDDSSAPICGDACLSKNPLTQACSCPADATPIQTKTKAVTGCSSDAVDTTITWCWRQSVTPLNFAGAWQTDDNGGQGCFVPHPTAGGCSCPLGYAPLPLRGVRYINSTVPFIGTTFSLCASS